MGYEHSRLVLGAPGLAIATPQLRSRLVELWSSGIQVVHTLPYVRAAHSMCASHAP